MSNPNFKVHSLSFSQYSLDCFQHVEEGAREPQHKIQTNDKENQKLLQGEILKTQFIDSVR